METISYRLNNIISVRARDFQEADVFKYRKGKKYLFGLIKEEEGLYYRAFSYGIVYSMDEIPDTLIIKEDGKVYYKPRVIVKFSDGSIKEDVFEDYEMAYDYKISLIRRIGTKEFI